LSPASSGNVHILTRGAWHLSRDLPHRREASPGHCRWGGSPDL